MYKNNAMDKSTRQQMEREIVRKSRVSSQEELSAILVTRGVKVTQATLSRDLRELRIVKSHNADGSYYVLQPGSSADGAYDAIVVSIEFSGQVCVIKTKPGCASAVATVVDSTSSDVIMGSLAGDDTIFVMLRQGADEEAVLDALSDAMPAIRSKLI